MSGQEILCAVGLASTSGVIEWHMIWPNCRNDGSVRLSR